LITKNKRSGLNVQKRSKFKDAMRFKEIAEILNIEFTQAEELFWVMQNKNVDGSSLNLRDGETDENNNSATPHS